MDGDDVGEPILLTYRQAWQRLGVTQSQFYRLMRRGEIVPLKLGPQVRRIYMTDLEEYARKLKREQHGDRPAA